MVVSLLLPIRYVDIDKIGILRSQVSREPRWRYIVLIKVLPLRYASPLFVAGTQFALYACHDQKRIRSSSACSRPLGKLHRTAPWFSSSHHMTNLAPFLALPHIQRGSSVSLRIVRPDF